MVPGCTITHLIPLVDAFWLHSVTQLLHTYNNRDFVIMQRILCIPTVFCFFLVHHSIVMETKVLPMATAIHIIYSVFGQSCSEKHKVSSAPLINHCRCEEFRFECFVFFS